eukprot:TRINITY_DN102178_c0_g1_i1.p1 TRINITY_DN102178_c0_g1~~TRINITY_DN102178_c0_g1_i1.p1  ORF type:complete len:345 (+),score=71.06 TRINITY_DN102178_c0_g1_i1:32-1066(+)
MGRLCWCFGSRSSDEPGQQLPLANQDLLPSTTLASTPSSTLPEGVDVVTDEKIFRDMLRGKRVLHVKGFGSGFKNQQETEKKTEAEQGKEALDALEAFSPDFMVVDGDPWGSGTGFQRHIQAYAEHQRQQQKKAPSLIWAKNVQMPSSDPEQEQKRLKKEEELLGKAQEWARQCQIRVYVYWIDAKKLIAKIEYVYGADAWTALTNTASKSVTGDRGLIKVHKSNRSWMEGLAGSYAGEQLKQSIETCEKQTDKNGKQGLEGFSFENSAKGNLIFELLTTSGGLHGVVALGGGESVLLEFASKYLNSKSGFVWDNAALFPHSRGNSNDPSFPRHIGKHFAAQRD